MGISAFDPSLPGITNRTEDCTLETIGKPVFKRWVKKSFLEDLKRFKLGFNFIGS